VISPLYFITNNNNNNGIRFTSYLNFRKYKNITTVIIYSLFESYPPYKIAILLVLHNNSDTLTFVEPTRPSLSWIN